MTRATRTTLLAAALATLAGLLAVGCTTLPSEGAQALIDSGDYRQGLDRYEQAMRARPGDVEPRLQYFRARDQVQNRLLAQGAAQLGAGDLDAAGSLYRQVLAIDAGNARAAAGLAAVDAARRHQLLAADARAKLTDGDTTSAGLMARAVLAEDPNHPQARAIERELRDLERKKALAVPVLKSRLQNPVNLEFRDAPLKLVMEALARSAGINFILDREIRADLRASVYVRNVRVEDALDLIIQNHQLEKKILTENTILIYPNNPQKLREHQELVMRTFHLGNADPKQAMNLLRTMLKTKDIHVDERTNMIVIRDTPDAVRAAEMLIAAQDVADPEVVLELEILEVSRTKVRDLGITYPSSFSGPFPDGGKLFQIGNLSSLSSRTIDVDTGFKLKLLRSDGDTKTLANPRMRIRNREKARVHVGDRVPVISSSFAGNTTSGQTSTAIMTEQIQYLDVGIKVEAEPTIYADDTVAIKINLDVSSLGTQTVTRNGSIVYPVGTRNTSTVLRLRNGETQALMGLIRDDDTQSGAGLPFISELPLLERIFGTKRAERRSSELVLLITPQLVRGVERTDAHLSEFWSGTEAAVRTRSPFVQQVTDVSQPSKSGAAANSGGVNAAAGATPATRTLTAAAPALPLSLSWLAPPSIKAGEEFFVELKANSEGPIKGASVRLRYNPEQVEVLAVDDGGYFSQVGGAVFTPRIEAGIGTIFATMGTSGAESASGDGTLIRLRLKSLKPGPGPTLQIGSIVGVDPGNRPVKIEGSVPLELKSLP